MVAEGAKRSPELIQLLELHTQFATITPYSQVGVVRTMVQLFTECEGFVTKLKFCLCYIQ